MIENNVIFRILFLMLSAVEIKADIKCDKNENRDNFFLSRVKYFSILHQESSPVVFPSKQVDKTRALLFHDGTGRAEKKKKNRWRT